MVEVERIISELSKDDRSTYEAAIRHIRELYKDLKELKFAIDQSAIIAITDHKGIITEVNDKFCEISQYSREELIGKTHRVINSGYHDRAFFQDMWRTIARGDVWSGQFRNRKKDGSFYWVQTTIVPFLDENGKPERYISIRTDITEQKKVEEQIYLMAHFDELTGLANRRRFEQMLESSIEDDQVSELAVAFVDLDRFSVINDTLGHKAGDEILVDVGKRLEEWQKRHPSSLASRYGGDEFILLIRNRTEEELEEDLLEVQRIISKPFSLGDDEFHLSASIGVAIYPEDGQTPEELIKHGDMAMYNAKSTGNSLVFHYHEHRNLINREMELERALHQSIVEGHFTLHYQPKVDLRTGKMEGNEALIRWTHPQLGTVSPGEFIPIAEKSNLIVKIGAWVLEHAIAQNAAWHEQGQTNLVISVNVSPVQLRHRFVSLVKGLLEKYDLAPEYLEIEITESVAMGDKKEGLRKLEALRSIGVKVAIDDFGKGYSSLSYLRTFGLDTLKIDREFIKDYSKETEAKSLIPGIIAIGHALGMQIVAEGVETLEQVHYLIEQGCDTIQGYVCNPPVPPEEIDALFDRRLF